MGINEDEDVLVNVCKVVCLCVCVCVCVCVCKYMCEGIILCGALYVHIKDIKRFHFTKSNRERCILFITAKHTHCFSSGIKGYLQMFATLREICRKLCEAGTLNQAFLT